MVKSFKNKNKKKLILFILYDFQKNFKLFFSKFQFQNWNFQNWNLGNMWTQNTQTHPPTSPTQHTNTPNDPPKIKTLITHKHTTHSLNRRVTHSLDSQIIKKKTKQKKEQKRSANPPNQILTHSLTHTSTLKKKKKMMLREAGLISIFIIHSVR